MKKTNTLFSVLLLVSLSYSSSIFAQWHSFDKGLPATFLSSGLAIWGTNVVAGNALTIGTSYSVYFTPDTTTGFTASSSNMGGGAANEIPHNIVACQGKFYTINQNAVYTSPDDGETWGKTSSIVSDTSYTSGNASYIWTDGSDIWAIAPPKVFKTTDAGATWTTYTFSKIDPKVNAFYHYKGVLYTGGKSGIIYSQDNGVTWDTAKVPSSLTGASVTGFALLKGNVYAATTTGIYRETDSGATWTQVFSKNAVSICQVGSVLLAGTGAPYSGIYKSDSGGTSWTAINTGLDYAAGYPVLGLISTNGSFVVAGVTDTGSFASGPVHKMYISTLKALGIPTGVGNVTQPAAMLYPNPAHGSATLILNDAFNKDITVAISDMAGRLMQTNVYHNTSFITINLSGIPYGMYMLHISDGANIVAKKLIVQ